MGLLGRRCVIWRRPELPCSMPPCLAAGICTSPAASVRIRFCQSCDPAGRSDCHIFRDWSCHGGLWFLRQSAAGHISVGSLPVAKDLVCAFPIPVLIAALSAGGLHRNSRSKAVTPFLEVAALLFIFAFGSWVLRQGVQGEFLCARSPTSPERYSYSVAQVLMVQSSSKSSLVDGAGISRRSNGMSSSSNDF